MILKCDIWLKKDKIGTWMVEIIRAVLCESP